MNALETVTKPILGPMIQGNRVVLTVEQQNILATSAHKTAMAFDLITTSSGVGFQKEGTLAFQNLSPLTCPVV